MADLLRLKSLANASHRFDSSLRPLTRFIVLFREICIFAKRLMVVRAGEADAKCAAEFLQYLSGEIGLSRALLLGLLAEAGSISLELIRFLMLGVLTFP